MDESSNIPPDGTPNQSYSSPIYEEEQAQPVGTNIQQYQIPNTINFK